ncbi:hypothetical protein U8527_12320 [Kordia algicida OT-1]|uniref:Uncharacterized protein n=1 Tax=Kordia algicida OT-1 TaxID=391587 RepID=A9E0N9_9FLAO|nr:hypothetical protein [Kordia algicida]EDP95908.1 hypothetical protein KAOT1_05872 [Kordia algicida OT-1]
MSKDQNTYNSDITKDDLQALRERTENTRTDGGDDSLLNNRNKAVDFAGKDLDVPGRTLPSDKKQASIKDEENQLYSQGGDGNEDLERTSEHIENV